jgi:hypothetical protein
MIYVPSLSNKNEISKDELIVILSDYFNNEFISYCLNVFGGYRTTI